MDSLKEFGLTYSNSIITIIFGIIFYKIITWIVKKSLNKSKIDKALHKFIINSLKCILLIIIFILFLDSMKVDTKSIVTVLGVSGGAIAFALKDSLSNVAGGIIILLTKPFVKGDFVDIGGTSGTVKQIDMILTTIISSDNKTITIPNGVVSSGIITNFTRADVRRVDCSFGVLIEDNITLAKDIMLEVAKLNQQILNTPEPVCVVSGHDNGKMIIDLKVWTKTSNYWNVKYFLEENILKKLNDEGFTTRSSLVVKMEDK